MIAYVARDKNGLLYLHDTMPERDDDLEDYYSGSFFLLEDKDFPEFHDITYGNGAKEVEINIKLV